MRATIKWIDLKSVFKTNVFQHTFNWFCIFSNFPNGLSCLHRKQSLIDIF